MLEELKEKVCRANLDLVRLGLVVFTWGNASGIDREKGLVVIKPSGVSYDDMKPSEMVVIDLDGNVVEGAYFPSSDTPTHLVLYKAFEGIGGVVHTHSTYATGWAQAGLDIQAMGTTHADYFHGAVPCTKDMEDSQIKGDYEAETGNVIVSTFADKDPMSIPAVLVRNHGPFTWGANPAEAVYHAKVLEEVARMNFISETLLGKTPSNCTERHGMKAALLDKHFFRKHGPDAYYGQKKK